MNANSMPDSIKGKRLEADAMRADAQRLLDNARQLDAAADTQQAYVDLEAVIREEGGEY